MIRKTLLTIGAGLALFSQPVIAQDSPEDEQAMAAIMEMFAVEPLTAEQQARLPAAKAIMAQMMPEGSLGEMMGSMFDKMLSPIMAMAAQGAASDVAEEAGIEVAGLDLNDEQMAEIAGIIDPAWQERHERQAALMPEVMSDMMSAMEPTMRDAMAEAYAIHFSERELADIGAFFETESGLAFARKSFAMSSDPRIIGASMQAMPAMMGTFAELDAKMQAATADLPAPRTHEDLTDAQYARIAELTGSSAEEVREGMEFTAIMKAEMEEAEEM